MREPQSSLALVDEINKPRDQPAVSWRAASPDERCVLGYEEFSVGSLCKKLKATDARRRRQIGERPTRANTRHSGNTLQPGDPSLKRLRPLGEFGLADVMDRSFQPPCRNLHHCLRATTQVEIAAGAG